MRALRPGLLAAMALLGLVTMTACVGGTSASVYAITTGGNADAGRQLIAQLRCGACHVIPGVRNANGMVGPPLMWFSRRTMIAGEIPNTPQNLERWVMAPKSVEPGTAMPALVATRQQARDIAAYLYTLR
ncbi:MAG TPA: c-type cytochrome [Vicinamibacterales bacterium]|jgi:cytochrome c2